MTKKEKKKPTPKRQYVLRVKADFQSGGLDKPGKQKRMATPGGQECSTQHVKIVKKLLMDLEDSFSPERPEIYKNPACGKIAGGSWTHNFKIFWFL